MSSGVKLPSGRGARRVSSIVVTVWGKERSKIIPLGYRVRKIVANLLANSFFDAKQLVQPAPFDMLQKRSGDVHVRIKRCLPRSQLRQLRDSRFQMCRIRREIPMKMVNYFVAKNGV